MRKINFFIVLSLFSQFLFADLPTALSVKEFKLKNGLTVWINEDASQSKVFGAVVVKAGAKDSPDTGLAHYLEHLLFKGTRKMGTVDYEAEKKYLDLIEANYDSLALTKDPQRRKELQRRINSLSIEAGDYAIPNEFDRLISKYGGSKLNAFTSYDITAYHNSFSPQYFRQWAELNSERLIDPVFRLFQNELEAVYEEKNMYMDAYSTVFEKLMERFFKPHPYMYSIIGSAENLKNPRLSEMREFFKNHYVGSNMGLMLSGNIDAEKALPIIEESFGRLPAGESTKKIYAQPADFQGEEHFSLKLPIPIVKATGLIWRGVPESAVDKLYLDLAIALLSNSGGTGFIDKLITERKVMFSGVFNESMSDAGALAAFVVPKLIFQSNKKAKALLQAEIRRLKEGDFSEQDLENVKIEFEREREQKLEDPDSRSRLMLTQFSKNKSWEEFLMQKLLIEQCTKEKIVAVANKYFTENYLEVKKKTGKYPKDNLPKPDFKPILPKHKDAESLYAKELEKLPLGEELPRLLDFEKDVKTVELSALAHLYFKENPLNDIFSLKLVFGKGTEDSNLLAPLSSYLDLLGTDSLSFYDFRNSLQALGGSLSFDAAKECFEIELSGFDKNFEPTLALFSHFMKAVKADDKQLKQLVNEKKMENKTLASSSSTLAQALFEKTVYGDHSSFLKQLSLAETKRLKSNDLLKSFKELQQIACDIHYCGNLPVEKVEQLVVNNIDISQITKPSNRPLYKQLKEYDEATVFFLHMPKLSQSSIYLYSKGEKNESQRERSASELFSSYLGGSMSSLVFQEIREFRSLAYGASAGYRLSSNKHKEKPGFFYGFLSTQGDKTIEAMLALDSLIKNMPLKPERIGIARQDIVNEAYNSYPAFRNVSGKIAELKVAGYTADPKKALIGDLDVLGVEEISQFYADNVKGRLKIYVVVGDKKKIDLRSLERFGKIVTVKAKDLYR